MTRSAVLLFGLAGALNGLHAQEVRRQLPRDTVIGAIPCAATGKASAEFYASGELKECPLSRAVTRVGHLFGRGTWLRFRIDGTLDGAWLTADTQLGNVMCRGDGFREWSVRFHEDESLRLCFVRKDTVIDGVPCLHGSFWNEIRGGQNTAVVIGRNGNLERCQVSRTVSIGGKTYRKWDVYQRG